MHRYEYKQRGNPEDAVDWVDNEEIRQMLRETRRCLNCGAWLPRGHGFKIKQGYCSQQCYYAKPPKAAYAEKQWGKPIAELMVEMLNKSTDQAVADMLGISKHTLYQWIRKYRIKRIVRYEIGL